MVVDKKYCMSSFLTFRYVVDEHKVFAEGLPHKNLALTPKEEKFVCNTAEEIDLAIRKQLEKIDLSNMGILLSGGMDSAILASYMPKGMKAYTARCSAPNAIDETESAKRYGDINGLEHVIVDVTWEDYQNNIDNLMMQDGCPVFANEPQVYRIVQKMKEDGLDTVIFGDNADMAFGGYDRLLSKDWTYNEWKERFSFVDPRIVLWECEDMDIVYRNYKIGENDVDYIKFMDEIFASSSSGAYVNAFELGKMKYFDPYAKMRMGAPFDLNRIRSGKSKYLIRELFKMKYPGLDVPEKIAMARAVDYWLKDWEGPKRREFRENCITEMTGEQKFLVYSLERFLNLIEK